MTGDEAPDTAAIAEPVGVPQPPTRATLVDPPWPVRDRRVPDDGPLSPQERYPRPAATP